MELVEEEAERRSMEKGKVEERIKVILALHRKGYPVSAISDILEVSITEVDNIIKKYVS